MPTGCFIRHSLFFIHPHPAPVAERNDDTLQPIVRGDVIIKSKHRRRLGIARIRVEQLTEREGIVRHDQPAAPNDSETFVQIEVVLCLVGVKKGGVRRIRPETRQDFPTGATMNLDATGNVGSRDPCLGEVGMGVGDFNRAAGSARAMEIAE